MSSEAARNAFTVDVEEWFHILDTADAPEPAAWGRLESRVEAATERVLGLLAASGVRGTFFFLGWVGERHPGLVRRVAQAGHEIASHGHAHRLAYRAGRERFREDARRAKRVLEDALGGLVRGYRAAGFSITPETPWAFDVLAEEGFAYDSSIFPTRRAHGGFRIDRRRPFRVQGPEGGTLWEFPIVPARAGPLRLPFAGGGYLRLWPLALIRAAHRSLNRSGVPVTYYVHPREFDAAQPRLQLPWLRRFRYYVNLASTGSKVEALLRGEGAERFAPLAEILARLEAGSLPADPPLRL